MAVPPFPFSIIGSGRVVTNPRTKIAQNLFQSEAGIAISRRKSTGISHFMSMVYVVRCEQRTYLEWHFDQAQGEMFEWRHAHVVGVVNARYIGDEISFTETGAYDDNGSPIYEAQVELEIIAPSRYTIRTICDGTGGTGIDPPWDPNPEYLYLAKTTAAFGTPAPATEWDGVDSIVRRKLLRPEQIEDDVDGLETIQFPFCEYPDNTESWLLGQFVSDPLAEQTLSGNVKGQVQFIDEIDPSGMMHVQVIIRIVSSLGVHKQTILNWTGVTDLDEASYTNRYAPAIVDLSGGGDTGTIIVSGPAEIDEGDRLVVEYGVISEEPTMVVGCDLQSIGMRRGSKVSGATTHLPEDETDITITKVPWIYFEGGVTFAS